MKANIHPQYFENAQVVCACGNRFTVGSTKELIHTEICHKCHPLYTGQQKFVDTVGRIERFRQKQEKAKAQATKKERQEKEAQEYRPRTLKEMLMGEK